MTSCSSEPVVVLVLEWDPAVCLDVGVQRDDLADALAIGFCCAPCGRSSRGEGMIEMMVTTAVMKSTFKITHCTVGNTTSLCRVLVGAMSGFGLWKNK